jgi:hypothetical protein
MLKKAGIKYSNVKRLYYIQFIDDCSFDQMMKVETSFYENISLVQIEIFSDVYGKKNGIIGIEDKNKYPNFNFVSNNNIQSLLKTISNIKRPLVICFYGCYIDEEIIVLLNSIHEIQALSFLSCSFGQCSLKELNTSRYFFSLILSKCTTSHDWKEILCGIKNFRKLAIQQSYSSNPENDLSTFFSEQIGTEKLEIQFMNIPKNAFDKIVFSDHLKSISILNSRIGDNDIIVLLKSVDKKTTVSLSNCIFTYDDREAAISPK